jgi:LL-diaminopimelate aminotransferase
MIESLIAQRLGGEKFFTDTTVYKFERIKRAKRAVLAERPGVQVLDFGVGEPDEMAPLPIVEALAREAADPANRAYADNGIPEMKAAAAKYLEEVYGVGGWGPERDIVHAVGAKSALAMLPSAFIDPGDVCLQTVPGYPILATHARWYGGEVYPMPIDAAGGFLPDLGAIPDDVARRAKLLYLNYPNNPTGATATLDFFKDAVEFAQRHRVLIVSDLAYGPLNWSGAPLSIFSVPGAREVALEIHSFSKAFNMTGWRLAFVVGASQAVAAFANVKDNYDSGQFRAIQKAGIVALQHPELTRPIREHYQRRLRLMVEALCDAGFHASMPGGSFYLYVRAPRGAGDVDFASAEDATEFLIRRASVITVPWDDVGPHLRFSATFEAFDRIDEERILDELRSRLAALELRF